MVMEVLLDLPEVVQLLCALGFSIRHVDLSEPSDVTPTGVSGQERRGGCRVVVSCTTSGLRVVLETVGEQCRCSTKQLNMAASNNQADRVITPLSEPVTLILKEFLLSLTKYATRHENTTRPSIADSPADNRNVLTGQKQTQNLQVDIGLCSGSNISGSVDRLLESMAPDHPFSTDKEISSCPSSPVARDALYFELPKSSSLETVSPQQFTGHSRRELYPAPDIRSADDIEKRLELATTCIQEALSLHRRNITENGTEKKMLCSSNVYKLPNVSSIKKKATTVPTGDPRSTFTGKPMKPKPLTPFPTKKTKPMFEGRTATPRCQSTFTMGRINAATNRRRTPNPSGL